MAGIAISAVEAAKRVTLLAATNDDPVIAPSHVSEIVAQFATIDTDGNAPTDDDWTPTYDVYAAVATAWRVKAGNAAMRYTFQAGDQRESESDLHKHCMAMADYYDRYRAQSVTIRGQVGRYDDAETVGVYIPEELL